MGYSISVSFKNDQEKQKMQNFLNHNQTIIDQLTALDDTTFLYAICDKDELGYPPEANHVIGFNGSIIPRTLWDLCAWMAVKSDIKNKNGDLFFYYDDEPMKVTFDVHDSKNTVVDVYGIRIKEDTPGFYGFLSKKLGLGVDYEKEKELLMLLNDSWMKLMHKKSVKP